MAVTHQPIFTQAPKLKTGRVTAANTARDGSGSVVTIDTVGADGAKLFSITATSAQATAAANSALVSRYWYSLDSGTTWRMLPKGETAIGAVTASNTVVGATYTTYWDGGIGIPASAVIGVTQSIYAGVADQFDYTAEYQNY